MSCQATGSGLQAIGAAVELFALLRIVWRPWLMPRLRELRRLGRRVERWLRLKLPFLPSPPPIEVKASAAMEANSALHAHGYVTGSDDPDKPPEERLQALAERVLGLESQVGRMEGEMQAGLREMREHASSEAQEAYERSHAEVEQIERESLRVRVSDALFLVVGVTLSLVGATVSATC